MTYQDHDRWYSDDHDRWYSDDYVTRVRERNWCSQVRDVLEPVVRGRQFWTRLPTFVSYTEMKLVMNQETLLASNEAADNLFLYLLFDCPGGIFVRNNILWLSHRSCISCCKKIENWPDLTGGLIAWPGDFIKYLFYVDVEVKVQGYDSYFPKRIFFYTSKAYDDVNVEDVDPVFLLLSKLQNVRHVRFSNEHFPEDWSHLILKSISRHQTFPVSRLALQSLVSEIKCSGALAFELSSLSSDQWRTIVFNRHANLLLKFGGNNWERGGAPLIEAMTLNQCPTKLEFWGFHLMPASMFKEFATAVEVNTSVREVVLWLADITADQFVLLIGAINRNRGLTKVDLKEDPRECSNTEWTYFFETLIAYSHPTLKSLSLPDFGKSAWQSSGFGAKILLQALQSNTVAVDILFSFLLRASDKNLVWLSGHSCISCCTLRNLSSFYNPLSNEYIKWMFRFDVSMWDSSSKTCTTSKIFFCTLNSFQNVDLDDVKTVLLLLSKLKTVRHVRFSNDNIPRVPSSVGTLFAKDISPDEPLPVSRLALSSLVSEVPCSVEFSSLSSDQWHTIAFNCPRNLLLKFGGYDWESGGAPLIEAMTLNQCPTKLELWGFHLMPASMVKAFSTALEVNTSVREIILWIPDMTAEQFVMLISAIHRNRGLTKLDLTEDCPGYFDIFYNNEWEYFFEALIASSHPTLKSLSLRDWRKGNNSLLKSLQSNEVLCEIHGRYKFRERDKIRLILERNKNLHLIQFLRQNNSFFATVLCDRDSRHCGDADFCYQLLRTNPYLVDHGAVDFSSCQNMQGRNAAVGSTAY